MMSGNGFKFDRLHIIRMLQTLAEIIETYLLSIIIVAITIIVSWLVNTVIKRYLRKREGTKKSKTINIVLNNLRPLYLLIIIIGVYLAFEILPFVAADTFKNFNAWIESFFYVILIFLICYVLARIVKIFVDQYFVGRREETRTPGIIMKMIAPVIFLMGIFIVLGTYNVDILPLLTTFGIGGIAVGFALQPTLTNLFAGLTIISDHHIHVGDYVEIKDFAAPMAVGVVHDIGWFSTRIRTFEGVTIVVPNSKLTSLTIFNHSSIDPKFITVSFPIIHPQDLDKIEHVIKSVAEEVSSVIPGASTARSPDVRFDSMDATTITVKVWLYLEKIEAQYNLKSEFLKVVRKKLESEGIIQA
jgi:small-conductance mechanosensitive channel